MNILIRCDSSFLIGSGHVIRCLNLATLLKSAGNHVAFACRDLDGNIIQLINERHFKVYHLSRGTISLPSQGYQSWLGASEAEELYQITEVIDSFCPDWVIVDHYGISAEWEKFMLDRSIKVLALDDIIRTHVATAVLDQNYRLEHESQYRPVAPKSQLFLGPEYSILSSEFDNVTPLSWTNLTQVTNILVFFGGVDQTRETLKFLDAISLGFPKEIHFKVVVGSQNQARGQILQRASLNPQVEVLIQINYMAKLMKESQILVGSGGTITWEKARLGLPSLCIAVAENQISIAENMAAKNMHTYLGFHKNVTAEDISQALQKIILQSAERKIQHDLLLSLNTGSRITDLIKFIQNH